MEPLAALLIATMTGTAFGLGLMLAMRSPLNRLLQTSCPDEGGVLFWSRFSMVMLVLSPVLFSVTFGLPLSERIPVVEVATLMVKVISSSIFGGFVAMIGMGLWVSSIARRYAAARR